MKRDLEKDLIEIECAIKSQREKDNIFTMSVLQRCHKLVSRLKEYKDLEEQGKLLKFPCTIGDIVYWLYETEILPMEIEYFMVLPNKIKFSFKYCGGGERLKNFTKYMYDNDIGKRVFLTREEAEAALKELEGKEE